MGRTSAESVVFATWLIALALVMGAGWFAWRRYRVRRMGTSTQFGMVDLFAVIGLGAIATKVLLAVEWSRYLTVIARHWL